MSRYLANLAARSYDGPQTLGSAGTIRPRLPSRFEPTTTTALLDDGRDEEETVVDRSERRAYRGLLGAGTGADEHPARGPGPNPEPHRNEAPNRAGHPSTSTAPALPAPAPALPSRAPDPDPGPEVEPTRSSRRSPVSASATAVVQDAAAPEPPARRSAAHDVLPHAALRPAVAVDASDGPPSPDGRERMETTSAPPVVHVTIGRVEVRAVLPAAAPRPAPPPAPRTLSLTDYLNDGNNHAGGRA